jgi:hypothetical protein
MNEKTMSKEDMLEQETSASFEAMANQAYNLINSGEYDGFRSLFELMLGVTRDQLQMIADMQSNPKRNNQNINLAALGLQAANLSGQALVYESILESPYKFIQQWNDYKDKKKGEKTS